MFYLKSLFLVQLVSHGYFLGKSNLSSSKVIIKEFIKNQQKSVNTMPAKELNIHRVLFSFLSLLYYLLY